ncbi:hypothetical protein AAG570_000545, partial [Ranatra chinensis]
IILAVAVACALAVDDAERVKKDVFVGGFPFGVHAVGVDDGKYYPGKYEAKAAVVPSAAVPYAGYPYAGYPYTYGAYPYSYGAYPYNYGAYPYYGYNYPLAAKQVACTMAEDAERTKKEVVVGGVHGLNFGYDDGKYYPGKYEKLPIAAYSGAYPYNYNYGAYPYSYGAYPYNYGAYPYSYGAHPYAYGAYPYGHHYSGYPHNYNYGLSHLGARHIVY